MRTPGSIIRKRLQETTIKSSELAFRADISTSHICDIEHDRRRPSPEVARLIFLTLNLSDEDQTFCVEHWTAALMAGWKELLPAKAPAKNKTIPGVGSTGLDDGPYLPGYEPKAYTKPTPKTPEENRVIRAKAWETRRKTKT
jgi:transcriptional regulator with XRE-family HTH domain